MTKETIGQRIKRLRKQKGYSQKILSEKIGCNQGSLSNYELGKRTPHMEAATSLAEALDISLDYLINGDNQGFLFNENKNNSYRVSDDGMSPEVRKGDMVTPSSLLPEENELAVIEAGEDTCIVRRIQYLSSKEINLLSNNPQYPPIRKRKDTIKLLGKLYTLYRIY